MAQSTAIPQGEWMKQPSFQPHQPVKPKRFPMPIPYGWFCVAYSNELKVGESMPLRYFGKDLVLFRTESGKAVVLDAYCPHLGAHLGYGIHEEAGKGGRVVGETIVCPFHAWSFDRVGGCEGVPYAKNIPPKVKDKQCLKSWPLVETNQAIYVWYHPKDEEPMWEVPEFEEANSDDWGELQRTEWIVETHPQEMAENGADPAHFLYVHRTATMPEWTMKYEDYRSEGLNEAKMTTPRGDVDGSIHNRAFGPGVAATRFSGICETFLMGQSTPIDEQTVMMRFAFTQRKDDSDSGVGKALIKDVLRQFEEDRPVWENKIYRPMPVLCDGDGPIAKFRKWYSQFYVDFDSKQL